MANCSNCGKKIGFIDGKVDIKGGRLCMECVNKLGGGSFSWMKSLSLEQIIAESKVRTDFTSNITYAIDKVALFDDTREKMYVLNRMDFNPAPSDYYALNYDQLIDFDLLENGASTVGTGAGSAAVGGMLFGTVGAIVGSAAGGQTTICNDLIIKLTVKNREDPAVYINLLNHPVPTDSQEYSRAMKIAQDILSKLNLIMLKLRDTQLPEQSNDSTSEIRRYKQLADEGIISMEEFEAKKKQLLGL